MMQTASIDPSRQEKAKIYARIKRRLLLVDLTVGGIYLLAWLLSGASLTLQLLLEQLTTQPWLQVLGFAVVLVWIYYLINLPLTYFTQFVLPHRFELSNQTMKGWVKDQFLSILVGGLIGMLLIQVVYLVLRTFPQTWWLWAAGFMLLFNVLLANLAPVLIAPLFYKFVPLAEEHAGLAERLMKLSARAGAHVKGVFKMDMSRRTKAANAALMGIGNTRRIVLGDTLINEFTADEIETVLAHELGHHIHRDVLWLILFSGLTTLLGFFLAGLALNWGARQMGLASPADVSAMPLLALVVALFGLVTLPLENWFSRWRERLADQYALQMTGKAEAFASAFARLANQNLAEAEPERWVEVLLYDHPALSRRIRAAQQFHAQHPS